MSRDPLVYVHIGTGRTPSVHYCETCDGYFGVPHDDVHTANHGARRDRATCACVPCQKATGRFPSGGRFESRAVMAAATARRPSPREATPQ